MLSPLVLLCFINQTPIADFHKAFPNGDERPLAENKSVIADKGTNVRASPNTKSTIVGQLKFGDEVVVLKRTKEKLTLRERGVTLSGSWVKIRSSLLQRDPTTKKYRRDGEGRLKRVEKTGYVFNGFLASDAFRPPNPRLLCDESCQHVKVSFASKDDFAKAVLKSKAIVPQGKRQIQIKEGGVKVILEDQSPRTLLAPKALKRIDGGAELSPSGFVGRIPLLNWSGHMGDGFVVLNPNTGKIERIVEGRFLALSPSGKSIAYYSSNGESDATELNVHFAGRPGIVFRERAWCLAGRAVFEDDKTLLVQVMRGNDCSNPEYDSRRNQLEIPLRIQARKK